MTVADIAVLGVGTGLIAWELWFFLGPRAPAGQPPATSDGVQEVVVRVKDGYDPDVIPVEAGRPVRLLFYRDETAACSSRLIFEGLGIDVDLPPFQTTVVSFTPQDAGDYPFRCHMSMLHGRVVAQVGREGARANLGKGHKKHG